MGYWWMLIDKQKRTARHLFREPAVQLPKNIHRSNRSARATRRRARAFYRSPSPCATRGDASAGALSNQAPISAQTQAGNTTASSGEKPNT